MRECVQCAAETAVGKRCKNRTCIYTEFCATHTKKLMDLELKPSSIAGAGRGLYTMVDIPKDTRISQYTGEMKTDKEYAKKESGYGVYLPGGKVLDAHSTQHGIARYANDCRTANKNKGECKGANARLTSNTRDGKTTVWLKSTKKIMAGHEIFISYGRGYWSGAPTRSHPPEEGKYDDWTVKSGNKHQPRVELVLDEVGESTDAVLAVGDGDVVGRARDDNPELVVAERGADVGHRVPGPHGDDLQRAVERTPGQRDGLVQLDAEHAPVGALVDGAVLVVG
jgi:hypothetical protein